MCVKYLEQCLKSTGLLPRVHLPSLNTSLSKALWQNRPHVILGEETIELGNLLTN